MEWLKELFKTQKPVIAMCHLQPMPGDPYYDKDGGMQKVVDAAYDEFIKLQEGGVDAVMFSNEFSMPYLKKVNPETTASMARVIGELKHEIKIPFGVNVLWDPFASLDLAAATGARFIREIMSGVYASDFGLWDTNNWRNRSSSRPPWTGRLQAVVQYCAGGGLLSGRTQGRGYR